MFVHHSYLAAYSYILKGAVTESYHCLYVESDYRFHKQKICLRPAALNLATFVIFDV